MPAVHGPPATGLSLRILGREVKHSEDLGRLDGKYVCWFHAADPSRFRDPSCRQQYDSGEALLKYVRISQDERVPCYTVASKSSLQTDRRC